MNSDNNGFGVIGIILIIAVVGILGFVGNRVYTVRTDVPETGTVQQSSKPEEEKKENKGIVITSGDSEFGTMLFDSNGQAIYIWELEKSTTPECYGDCAEAWPPVLTDGSPSAEGSVSSELLGTVQRTDGSTQVTYKNHPLYYYAHEKAGEVKCHDISTHGGLWWVIQPNGSRAD